MEGTISELGVLPQSIGFLLTNMISQHKMNVSFYEIYNETLYDLLKESTDDCKKIDIFTCQTSNGAKVERVTNLKEVQISNRQEFCEILAKVNQRRKVSATDRNLQSSRSHAVIQISLRTSGTVASNIMFLDLAGSENLNDHSNSNDDNNRVLEMRNINKSVGQLRNVIESLKKKESAVDYRSSKLTYLLKPSLTRNCKTLIITTISQATKYFTSSKESMALAQSAAQIKFWSPKISHQIKYCFS